MTRAALAGALVLAACGDNRAVAIDAAIDPEAQLDDTPAWVEIAVNVSTGGGGSTGITGHTITDPELWPYGEPSREGSCRMWTRAVEICDEPPFCEWTETCVGGACRSSPPARSVGALTVSGGGETRTLPFEDDAYHWFRTEVPFPPGTEITASAPGDVVGAFTATTTVPRPLELLLEGERVVATAGQPLELRWVPADPGSRVRLTLGADFGHAQHRPVVIECDAPDEHGHIAVPQAMVDELADRDHWACGICIGQEAKRYRRVRTTAGALPLSVWAVARAGFDLRPGA